MDIFTHTLSGLTAGTVMASCTSQGWKHKLSIIFFSGLGGALPDLDAISMWSKFDVTFGKLFHLEHTGRVIYSSKFWYSHHGFMHSLLAAFLIAVLIGILFRIFQRKKKSSLLQTFIDKQWVLWGFIAGFVIHLLQDMITPASAWGGVRLFFPSEIYVGGTGEIWWWNNYNLFLTVVCVLFINCILLLLFNKSKPWRFIIPIFVIGCFCFFVQVKSIN
ncbi:MAG: metal-dependent hydrolase [Bacteroides sp.]|nr:metal-dependent hydrolase [Bacteroides sp.]